MSRLLFTLGLVLPLAASLAPRQDARSRRGDLRGDGPGGILGLAVATSVVETMTGTDDHILTRWELEASPQEVYGLIADAPSYPRWWPSVFLESRVLEPGDESGVGRVVEVRTATLLPLSIRWRYRVTAAHAPDRLAVETSGGLEGLGLWTFEARGRTTVARFNWRGRVQRAPFRQLPTLLRPLTRACQRWAMERGFTSLLLEIWRRRTDDQDARDWLPPPPGPAFPRNLRRRGEVSPPDQSPRAA